MSNVIELDKVTKVYRFGVGEVHALRGVSISIPCRDFVCVVGPSGSGKSSLLHIMGCVDRPSAGMVKLNGQDLANSTDADLTVVRRRAIGFIFQQFFLIPTLTAVENVLVPTLFSPADGAAARARELLEIVGLKERVHHRVTQLSGGEMQRVAIARALINNPGILLADEPTGNLDSAAAAGVFDLFSALNEQGLTVVVVTHNLELAARAKRVLTLRDGRL